MVNDGVKFVVGHLCSSSTQPASDIYEDEGVIMITPAATSPEITARGYKLIFRTIGLDSAQGPAAGNYIADHVKPKIVAVLHDKQQYGEGIATAVKQTLEKKGTKVAVFEGLNAGDKDFSSIIQKLKQANVDFVYYGGYHPELGPDPAPSQGKRPERQVHGPRRRRQRLHLANRPGRFRRPACDPAEILRHRTRPTRPSVEEFAKNKQGPNRSVRVPAYSAIEVIAGGITAAKSEDTAKVAAAIHAGTFKTPTGELSFDAKGDLKDFKFVVYEWHFGKPKTEVSPQ